MRQLFSHRLFLAAAAVVAAGLALAAPRPKDLLFLHYWIGTLSGGVEEMVAAFGRGAGGASVRAQAFEHESFKSGIRAMLASSQPPDLFSYWAGARTEALVREGLLAPADDLWRRERLDRRFPRTVVEACTYGGKRYLVPVTQHWVGFFYNKKLFRKNGLKPPATWEAFLQACRRLKAAGVAPIALGARERWPAQFWFDYLLLRTAGPAYRERLMAGRARYTDPEVARAFESWKAVAEAGYFRGDPNAFDWSEAARMVRTGDAAMTLMGTWAIGFFEGQLGWKQGEEFDFFPFPAMEAGVPAVSVGAIDAIALPVRGRVEEAAPVLGYFAGREPQERMARGSGALSPSLEVSPAFYSNLQRRVLAVVRAAPAWAFNYDLATPPPVAEAGLDAFRAFLQNPARYREVLAEAERRAAGAFGRR